MLRFDRNPLIIDGMKYILMDESLNPNQFSRATSGAVLLPPPMVLIQYADTCDSNLFYNQYHQYLFYNARDFLASIIFDGVYRNDSITIMLDDNYEMYFGALQSFMNLRYGVCWNTIEPNIAYIKATPVQLQNLEWDLTEFGLADQYKIRELLYPNMVNAFQ